jgi:hypothetical protein
VQGSHLYFWGHFSLYALDRIPCRGESRLRQQETMAGKAAKSEWYVGSEHEELLEITRQLRRQRSQLQAHAKPSITPTEKDSGGKKFPKYKIPVHEAAERVRRALEDNYDDLYDAYTEFDTSKNGRLTRNDFRNGLKRCLGSSSANNLQDASVEELFDAIDVDKSGFISLKQFLVAFHVPDYRSSRKAGDGDFVGGARSLVKKTGGLAVAEDREARVKRDFEEVSEFFLFRPSCFIHCITQERLLSRHRICKQE